MFRTLKSFLLQAIKISMTFVVLLTISFSLVGEAQGSIRDLDLVGINCLISGDLTNTTCLINNIINFLLTIAPAFAVLVIVWGGYMYFMGGLNGKAEGAKTIQAGVVGLIITLMARFIAQTIQGVFAAPGTFTATPIITLITNIINNLLIPISGIVALLVIVWGGYKFFFSGLDIEKEGGVKNIRSGVIGLIVILLARFIVDAITGTITITGTTVTFNSAIFEGFINQITNTFLFPAASAVAILVIMYGGYKYYFSGVGASKEDGLKNIRSGIIGLIAVLLARLIITIVTAVFPSGATAVAQLNVNPIITNITSLINNILIPISTGFAIFFFILAGYLYITAQGNAEKLKKAEKAAINAVIGFLVVLLAATVIQLVLFVVGTP